MKPIVFLLFFFSVGAGSPLLIGQSNPFHRVITTRSFDRAADMIQTADGGYALAGSTGAEDEDGSNMYVVKTDSAGAVSWSTVVAFDGPSGAEAIVEADNGDLLVAGYALSHQNDYDACVVRFDSAGTVKWRRFYGSSNWDFAYDIIKASTFSSGFIIVGERGRTNGYSDAWIFQINDDGDEQINLLFGGDRNDVFTSVDVQTGFYVAGGHTVSFSDDDEPDYMVKYLNFELDEVAEYIWGSDSADYIRDITFIGDQAEAGVAAGYDTANKRNAAAFRIDRNSGVIWKLDLDSANTDTEWMSVQRDGLFNGLWAGKQKDGNGLYQIVFQGVETVNGVADSTITLPSNDEYEMSAAVAGSDYFTFAGTRREGGSGFDDLFLIKTRKQGQFAGADSTVYTDTTYQYVLNISRALRKNASLEVRLYPNPAADYFTVERKNAGQTRISLFDMTGNEVLSRRITERRERIDVSQLAAGVYSALIVNEEQQNKRMQTVKVIITD